ncbi:26S proteasome non-ATPase regulatory subunit 9 [Purpureocillium lilacinum]|uniref:Probable 26S proteasome regulatory subunit p27 n=1 Tax=Purpureocillium lilacinum TaxID=33203 RepID=A0A179HQW8_PURLI|nr:26S proteasome non-ATPase regulatory subunit 9 [Purpureocillium lilacinum]OAQ91810.1 26S proteasome non-ATPase regulatory subunit 9 [Purpureocillium lilacinum]GJN73137.1 putative 26S proteasome regulatory subunit [Purpureocillium lilacinum]GJN83654.1 putative 26S proteasome regulatory subunit [Purpureocillium lilacinum]
MNTLHAPTVPSGPTSAARTNGQAGHLSFAELQRKKDDTEAELKALGAVLDSHGVDMETPLLTRDGFPRADIDVAQIRTTRARIIRLRNDYKDLMSNIEKFLHEHFANVDDAEPVPAGSSQQPILPDSLPTAAEEPFARVNSVAPGSPAERAGLKAGDEIRVFGYVNKSNHDNLKKVAECVQGNEGGNIFIRVSRTTGVSQREELRLTLTPTRDWGGRGMLGCHILPL